MILRLNLKLISLFAVLLNLSAQESLSTADSLFREQDYTEAYSVYDEIFRSGSSSSAMLLKMAFIKEGLGEYSEALYYLNLYYRKTADRGVVEKIATLSEEYNLIGYSYDDTYYFRVLLRKFTPQIQLIHLALLVLFSSYIYLKLSKKERPVFAVLCQFMLLLSLLAVSNPIYDGKEAIISDDSTLLRSGPSAGAEPVQMLSKGHRVRVLEELPVWTKIVWDGEEAYIRKGRLQII